MGPTLLHGRPGVAVSPRGTSPDVSFAPGEEFLPLWRVYLFQGLKPLRNRKGRCHWRPLRSPSHHHFCGSHVLCGFARGRCGEFHSSAVCFIREVSTGMLLTSSAVRLTASQVPIPTAHHRVRPVTGHVPASGNGALRIFWDPLLGYMKGPGC